MSAGSRDNMGHSRSDRVYETLRLRIHSGELHSGMLLIATEI